MEVNPNAAFAPWPSAKAVAILAMDRIFFLMYTLLLVCTVRTWCGSKSDMYPRIIMFRESLTVFPGFFTLTILPELDFPAIGTVMGYIPSFIQSVVEQSQSKFSG